MDLKLASSLNSDPFEYVLIEKFLKEIQSLELLRWLEENKNWRLKSTDFYSQWEFHVKSSLTIPDNLSFLIHPHFQSRIRSLLEQEFRCSLGKEVSLSFHKMVPEQEIQIHNDFLPDEISHRLVIQLNRGWSSEKGGYLILHEDYDGRIHRILLPIHNTGIAFKISNSSLHSVIPVLEGERYTLVYTFTNKDDNKDK